MYSTEYPIYKTDEVQTGLYKIYIPVNIQETKELNGYYYEECPTVIPASSLSEATSIFENQKSYYEELANMNFNKIQIEKKIDILKNQLAASDYKFIKCYEFSLVGELMPYDYTELIEERNSIREEINRLQGELV